MAYDVVGQAKEFMKGIKLPTFKSVDGLLESKETVENVVGGTIKIVEAIATEDSTITGADKQKAVIQLLDDMIKLPAYMEWLDNLLLPAIIDSIVKKYNEKSKSWGTVDTLIKHGLKAIASANVV